MKLNLACFFSAVVTIFPWHELSFLGSKILTSGKLERPKLSPYINYYEPVRYDSNSVHNSHIRAKRSPLLTKLHIRFHALGRSFHLRLRRDTSSFSPDVLLEQADGSSRALDTSHIYEGELVGEPSSRVHGSVIDGVFAGSISSRSHGNYWVERVDAYSGQFPAEQHSVIYAERHMAIDPHRRRREAERAAKSSCGSANDDVRRWMEDVQNSVVEPPADRSDSENGPEREDKQHTGRSKQDRTGDGTGDGRHNPKAEKYSAYMNRHNENHRRHQHHRHKRQAGQTAPARTCTLFLQSDTLLWDRMTNDRSKGGLNYSAQRAREELSSLFASHVAGLKRIYEDTVFESRDRKLSYSQVSFVVHRVKMNETESACKDAFKHEYHCRPYIDVSNFLNINSLRNHDDFCLAYVFTYRDFSGGTLGLAWVGAPTRAAGGICEQWKEYQENQRRVFKSLNTGIVTLINYNSPVPPRVSTLTFAHEVGHNFGSPHDSGSECTPFTQATSSNSDGNYIMYASATTGDYPNNSKFSVCSKANISLVLDAVFNEKYGKKNCFQAAAAAFCGNRLVEGNEECDCGYAEDCKAVDDKCCYGRGSELDQCKLKPNKKCSPSQGPCCHSKSCEMLPMNGETCHKEGECTEISNCNGNSARCPTPKPKPNETVCNNGTQICFNGSCQFSICRKINWSKCFLEAPSGDTKFDKGALCFVSCQAPGRKDCVSTGDLDKMALPENKQLFDLVRSLNVLSLKFPPGEPCNNYRGYCDVFQKCRDVDADGPLARLKKILFNTQTFNEIRDWIVRHWYAVLLMAIALIVVMGIFIQICAVHTPSSNPKKPPARKLTLGRQPRTRQPKLQTREPGTSGEGAAAYNPAQQSWQEFDSIEQMHNGPPPPYSGYQHRGGPPHGKGRGPRSHRPSGHYEMQPKHSHNKV